MTMHSLSSRDFTAHVAEAKRWANHNPVFINDRGQPTHVLLSISEYQRLTNGTLSVAQALAMESADGFDIEFPKANLGLRPMDLEEDQP